MAKTKINANKPRTINPRDNQPLGTGQRMSPLFTKLRITDKGEITRRWTPKERQNVIANTTNQPKNPASPPKRDRDIRDTVRYRRLAGSEGFQTVKPEAAQEATSKREKAKELRRRADSDPRFSRVWGKRAAQIGWTRSSELTRHADRLDRESKEALKNLERPRTVTANVPKRATSPRSNTAREERNLRGDS